jgi:uncharacterized protein
MYTVHRMRIFALDSFERGTTTWCQLLPSGDIPEGYEGSLLAVLQGREDGPIGYIGAGTHGDELNSIEAVRRVASSLDPSTLKGTLILGVAQNLNSFNKHVRMNPLDDKNPDHCFPGRPNGSPTEILAHTLFEQVIRKADYVLDLHCASRGGWNPLYSVVFGETRKIAEKSIELASQFGSQVVLEVEQEDGKVLGASIGSSLDHNLFTQSARAGKPAAIVEFGASAQLTQVEVDLGVRGIINVLRAQGQLTDVLPETFSPFVTATATTVHAPVPGFLTLEKQSGEQITEQERIGFIKDLTGNLTELHAPADGVVLRTAAEATVALGDRVITVATKS